MPIRRTKEQCYLYTMNPSPIHHNSQKVNHHLKIVDFYIQNHCPEKFVIEPVFGSYSPDVYFEDNKGNHICVEIQLTQISYNKMKEKVNNFVKEYGKTHNSKVFVLCSEFHYPKLKVPKGFRLIRLPLPNEVNM